MGKSHELIFVELGSVNGRFVLLGVGKGIFEVGMLTLKKHQQFPLKEKTQEKQGFSPSVGIAVRRRGLS